MSNEPTNHRDSGEPDPSDRDSPTADQADRDPSRESERLARAVSVDVSGIAEADDSGNAADFESEEPVFLEREVERERLQKVLARAGVGSRRQIEELVRQGRVMVNGRVAELGQKADLEADAVKVDGKRIRAPKGQHVYILLYKPVSVVSTRNDPEGRPTVLDLVPARFRRGLVTVGRLDYDSEGLLLLTNDGSFAHRVAHPKFGCLKTYEVKVKGAPGELAIEKLRSGVVVDGRRTAPARIESHGGIEGQREASANTWWRVGLSEGRPRQIREMFHRVGHPVQRLRRVAIGPLADPRLAKGSWRLLSAEEVGSLLEAAPGEGFSSRGRSKRPSGQGSKGGSTEGWAKPRRSPKSRGAARGKSKASDDEKRPSRGPRRGPAAGKRTSDSDRKPKSGRPRSGRSTSSRPRSGGPGRGPKGRSR